MTPYPKLLVVAPRRLDWLCGSGVTMCNLLKGWPLDRIAQVHFDSKGTGADETVCRQHVYCKPGDPDTSALPAGERTGCLPSLVRYALGRQDTWGPFAHGTQVMPFVRDFSPDIIYSYVLQAPPVLWSLPRTLARTVGVPYVPHIMDDWPEVEDTRHDLLGSIFWKPVRRWALRRLFRDAALSFGICAEMCEAFSQKYPSQFRPFHNCVEMGLFGHEKCYSRKSDGTFDIVYIGTVRKAKELDSLIELRDAIHALAKRVPGIRLTIHHPECEESIRNFREFLHSPPYVVAGGYMPREDLPQRLVAADVLVLALGFSGESEMYLRYSFQTKTPEYLASGTPVLLYGPATNPNVLAARRDGWGLVVDRRDQPMLMSALTDLLDKVELRESLGMAGRRTASNLYDAQLVRDRFRDSLASAVEHRSTGT